MLLHQSLPIWFRLLLVIASLASASGQTGVWSPIGPTNATVMSLQQDSANPSLFYAGLYFGGIFRSTDSGANWSPLPSPFTSDVVFTLTLDPSRAGTLYAGTFQRGLFKSVDSGATWTSINAGIPTMDDEAFGVDPNNSNILLVGSGGNGYRSTDAGLTWKPIGQYVRTIFFDSVHSGVVYLGTYANGLMKSTDDGVTFAPMSDGIGTNTVLSLHESRDGQMLYAAALQGIFVLQSGQSTWINITGTLPWDGSGDILSLPDDPSTQMAGTSVGVYVRNATLGSAWTRVSTVGTRFLYAPPSSKIWIASSYSGLYSASSSTGPLTLSEDGIQNYFVEALASVPSQGGTQVFAGTDRGVFNLPAGGSWSGSSSIQAQTIFSLVPKPSLPTTVYAGTQTGGVWQTIDAGKNWASLANGMVPRQVTAIAQFVDVKQVILAATTNGIFQSLDNGQSWNETLLQAGVLSLATDASVQASAYVGAAAGQVLRTTDYGNTFQGLQASGLPQSNVIGLTVIPYDKLYAILANGQSYALYSHGGSWIRINGSIPYPITCVTGDPADLKTAYMGTSGGGVYKSTDFGATWTPVNSGLSGLYVYSLVVDPSNSSSVYAATNLGVLTSRNGASNWQQPGTGLPSAPILSMVMNPMGKRALTVSVLDKGVYRSLDQGQTWAAASVGPPQAGALTLAVNPLFPATVYAGSLNQGFYLSTDSADHWTASNAGLSVFVRSILVDPGNTSRMFAASLSDGLFRSMDAGSSWQNIALNDRNLFGLAFDPTNTQTVYAASSIGVSKSTDGGKSWQDLGQHNPYLFTMAVSPATPQTIYTGSTQGKVYKSVDSGSTWSEASNGLPLGDVLQVSINNTSGTIYAAVNLVGVYRSTDGGANWLACGVLPALTTSSVTGLSVDAATGSIYVSGDSIGVFRSLDGCQNWQSSNSGVYSASISALLASQQRPSLLFAGTNGVGLYRSTDGASTWSLLSGLPTSSTVLSITEDSATSGTLYAGTATGIFRSADYGITWNALASSGLPPGVGIAGVAAYGSASPLYAVAGNSGLYRMQPGSSTWQAVSTPAGTSLIRSLTFGGMTRQLYVASLGSGFIKSSDAGASWTSPISLSNVQTVTNVVIVDPVHPQTIYSATGGTGVQKSLDGGLTWQAADQGLTELYVVAMVMDPKDPATLYVGSAQGGVFVTRDGAQTWTSLVSGLYDLNVVSLALDGKSPQTLYAGTEGAGVFRIIVP